MKIIEIVILICIIVFFIIGVVGVIVEKIKTGKDWIGQGFGRK